MGESFNDRATWLARHVMPYELPLRRWLNSRRFPNIDIDDVIQETYAILSALKSIENIRNPKQYAFRTAYSIILAQLRRARIVSITAVADLDALQTVTDSPSPESQVGDREELRNVQNIIRAMPKRVREVFILRRISGLSQREVAEHLEISENIVEKCIAQGVEALLTAFIRGGKISSDTQMSEAERVSSVFLPAPSLRGSKKSI